MVDIGDLRGILLMLLSASLLACDSDPDPVGALDGDEAWRVAREIRDAGEQRTYPDDPILWKRDLTVPVSEAVANLEATDFQCSGLLPTEYLSPQSFPGILEPCTDAAHVIACRDQKWNRLVTVEEIAVQLCIRNTVVNESYIHFGVTGP